MKLDRLELLKVLDAAKPGLSRKEIVEETIRFIFTGEAVCTFNDDICIIFPYKTDFQGSVNGEELYKILAEIKEPEVDITITDNHMLIRSKKTKAGLSTVIGEKERVDTIIKKIHSLTTEKGFWRKLPIDFIEGVNLCMFNASKDMTMGALCCVASKDNMIYSSDKVRISRFIMTGTTKELLIPARHAVELIKYPITKYGISESWIHFKTDEGVMFNCKKSLAKYPYDLIGPYFDKKPTFGPVEVPVELQDLMKSSIIMASGDENVAKMVDLKIEKGKISCRSEKERGWLETETDFDYNGEVLQFIINPINFIQVLTKATTFALIQKEEAPDKAIFTRDNFKHMIALP